MNWILTIVIAVLVGLIAWQEWNNRKERAKLINAIIGKNAQEVASLDLADKTEISNKPPHVDIMPLENMDEEDFDKVIKKQNG